MIQLTINLITHRILKEHIQMKILIAKIIGDPAEILRFSITNNLTVILIDNIIIVHILPNGVTTGKYRSIRTIC
ncbi:hypothetical protein D3C81_1704880 [compost metagenome]